MLKLQQCWHTTKHDSSIHQSSKIKLGFQASCDYVSQIALIKRVDCKTTLRWAIYKSRLYPSRGLTLYGHIRFSIFYLIWWLAEISHFQDQTNDHAPVPTSPRCSLPCTWSALISNRVSYDESQGWLGALWQARAQVKGRFPLLSTLMLHTGWGLCRHETGKGKKTNKARMDTLVCLCPWLRCNKEAMPHYS